MGRVLCCNLTSGSFKMNWIKDLFFGKDNYDRQDEMADRTGIGWPVYRADPHGAISGVERQANDIVAKVTGRGRDELPAPSGGEAIDVAGPRLRRTVKQLPGRVARV